MIHRNKYWNNKKHVRLPIWTERGLLEIAKTRSGVYRDHRVLRIRAFKFFPSLKIHFYFSIFLWIFSRFFGIFSYLKILKNKGKQIGRLLIWSTDRTAHNERQQSTNWLSSRSDAWTLGPDTGQRADPRVERTVLTPL